MIETIENEDVLNVILLVNEDLQKTFDRFTAIKNSQKADPFIPGEKTREVHYLAPTSQYNGQIVFNNDMTVIENENVDLFNNIENNVAEKQKDASVKEVNVLDPEHNDPFEQKEASIPKKEGADFGNNNDILLKL